MLVRSLAIMTVVAASAISTGCNKAVSGTAPAGPPSVGVFKVVAKPLAMTTELPGRTSAFQVAEVRPQVGGIIQKRLFQEGGDVKAGVSLYQIDPATYQAAYDSARAALMKSQANLLTAKPKADRYKDLVAIQGVSQQEYDDAVAAYEQAKADVEASKASLETARINLKFTGVAAPISGRIGKSSVTSGALVTAGQTNALTTIQQLDPIYVDVTQSSTDLLNLKRQLENGSVKRGNAKQARVTLLLEDGSKYAESGNLQFSDVTVDQGTGAVTLRALFPNPKGDLLPGMYVRAVLDQGIDENAIVVPQQGVTRNQKGEATALILTSEGKVEQRVLKTGRALGNQWLVTSGLNAGDRVIVDGLQKVKLGQTATEAKPTTDASATAAAASAPKSSS